MTLSVNDGSIGLRLFAGTNCAATMPFALKTLRTSLISSSILPVYCER